MYMTLYMHDYYERLKLSYRLVIDDTELLIYVRSTGSFG